ncbi:DNA starvation/stationary phase protection protein DpsA [Brevibacillus sp. SYSU BS000544]|uniref:DNA starvation/stationary phase protection protein DpsA n=1 Tax=Brevibacillus sp. SYSU BS000544 TaxID=3416443 RepID=UPI003CE5AB21
MFGKSQGMLLQKLGEVKPNPVGLEYGVAKPTSDGLNILVASCFTLFHQIKKHHWIVEGPFFRDLHMMLDELAIHLQEYVDQLAERITLLGAYPISTPRKQQEMAVFPVEEEGVFQLSTMLSNDYHAYKSIIIRYRDIIRHVSHVGDFATEHMLREQLTVLENDVHQLEHFIGKHETHVT